MLARAVQTDSFFFFLASIYKSGGFPLKYGSLGFSRKNQRRWQDWAHMSPRERLARADGSCGSQTTPYPLSACPLSLPLLLGPTHSLSHISFRATEGICLFDPERSLRERRDQLHLGVGKAWGGEVSFKLGLERSAFVHRGERGGGDEEVRQPGQCELGQV